MSFQISGNIVDVFSKRIIKGEIHVSGNTITDIKEVENVPDQFILPGFIDAHVHIESSMLVPSEFARLAVGHGTVATVSDPHEIANVLGLEGVKYMVENGKQVPFKFYFGAPSCVPATTFETAGGEITLNDIEELFSFSNIKYLAEMMNWPGVLFNDKLVYEKIHLAKKMNKLIDGHAPGLRGEQVKKYAEAGITSDHECFTKEEALDKIACGMKVIIREGSAAKNFESLIELLHGYEDHIMFCSDDKHPDSLMEGHINTLVKRSLEKNIELFKILKAACFNPVKHYGLEVGLLQKDDPADFIVVDNLKNFKIEKTFIGGKLVAENGKSLIGRSPIKVINKFNVKPKTPNDFVIEQTAVSVKIIEALDGQLITNSISGQVIKENGHLVANLEEDILKITVVNRYQEAKPALAFIKNFGIKEGALASSVAHDSHNIIAVGVDDTSLCLAVNEIIKNKGGICAVHDGKAQSLALPIAGLMSDQEGELVATQYTELDRLAKAMGSKLSSPFMTLSFMALLVIPSLKLSDQGLFDGEKFEFVEQ